MRGARRPEDACALAVAEPGSRYEGLRDDVAIVALQNSAVPRELHLTLPAEPRTLAHVRRMLRRWLAERGADEADVAEMTIAVSEACANAIEHAYSPVAGQLRAARDRRGRRDHVTVRDEGRWRAPRGQNRGRGLSIIVAAMDDVQIDRTADGTEVVMRRRIATEMSLADVQITLVPSALIAHVTGEVDMSNAEEVGRDGDRRHAQRGPGRGPRSVRASTTWTAPASTSSTACGRACRRAASR